MLLWSSAWTLLSQVSRTTVGGISKQRLDIAKDVAFCLNRTGARTTLGVRNYFTTKASIIHYEHVTGQLTSFTRFSELLGEHSRWRFLLEM